jgi:hypothetical protein
MKTCIIIPSKQRAEVLAHNLYRHMPLFFNKYHDFDIIVLIEKEDYNDYKKIKLIDKLIIHPKSNMGGGYAKKRCVEVAEKFGYDCAIFMDDNVILQKNSKLNKLAELTSKYAWVSGWNKYYDFSKRIPHGNIFAMNIKKFIEAGNFDENINFGDDLEMRMRLLLKNKKSIKNYKGVIFSKKRNEVGGLSSFKTPERLQFTADYINKKYNINAVRVNAKTFSITPITRNIKKNLHIEPITRVKGGK